MKSTQKKSEIIYNPVNPKFYKADNRDPKKEIAMVGRLQPQKNYYLAIQAFSNVVKKYPDYKLVIYGDGILKIELQNLCKHLNIDNSVIFYGVVDAVEEKLSTASIFLLSSDFEGMPNALMEAMAVGIPVISTDCPCGGPKALIESDIQGILVPCGNIDKMSEALCRLIENEGLRIKMGLEAKKRALDFLPEIVFKAWDDYVNKVCIQ